MKIREYGEIILCKDITFEDNKVDEKYGHPGIVLLPSSENEDYVYCLYMTSDAKRALKENIKYKKSKEKLKKTSYINIQQIVKRTNVLDGHILKMDNNNFRDLLETFYNYQIELDPQKPEFLEIKGKVETLLQLLNFNKNNNISKTITRSELDILEKIEDKNKKEMIYSAYLSSMKKNNFQFLKLNDKSAEYLEKLLDIYNKISKVNFDKLDFNNENNQMRQIYLNFINKNYFINGDTLFKDVATIFDLKDKNNFNSTKIKEFIKFEQERKALRERKIRENIQIKQKERKAQKKAKEERENKKKNKKNKAKYGKFNPDFYLH